MLKRTSKKAVKPKKFVKRTPAKKAAVSRKKTADLSEKGGSYEAKDIHVLQGLEPVRKRPGMYVGSTGPDGLHHLIFEVVDNGIDEAMAGYAKRITVELLPDGAVSVTDDGRGIPVGKHPQTKKSTLETVMTTLHAGGKFGGGSYKVSGGLHGVGVSVVNALSSWLRAEVRRDGARYVQEYERGRPTTKVKKVGKATGTGTTIAFTPDPKVFVTTELTLKRILDHFRQQAYLTKGVRIDVVDRRTDPPQFYGFYFEGGLKSFVQYLARDRDVVQDEIFYAHKELEHVDVEVAFVYTDGLEIRELSFANNIYNPEGGMHLTGFRSALTRSLNTYARSENHLKEKKDDNLTSEDVREGMLVVISVKLPEPQFEGQTKAKLGNPEARTAVESVVGEALKEYLERHPRDARRIIEKAVLASKARKAAKAAKDTVLRKGALEGANLPGKLADCSSRDPEESEIFIVEGDSAGGTAKAGRDRRTQAILPLRGKILNVERARLDKMLANQEIRTLVIALGTAIAEEFDLAKLRYHKIVIMTDADVDGAHIRTLLLTLFYRYFPRVVEQGHLYIAQPPLYQIKSGKEVHYVYTEAEKERIVSEIVRAKKTKATAKTAKAKGKKAGSAKAVAGEEGAPEGEEKISGVTIQRYKGLGEMNADQLWETTMNPEDRILKRVTIEDAEEANHLFDVLMGDKVEPRKQFIQAHAASVRNLDV